ARHHAAMRGRHPVELALRGAGKHRTLRKIIEKLDEQELREILERERIRGGRGSATACEEALEKLLAGLEGSLAVLKAGEGYDALLRELAATRYPEYPSCNYAVIAPLSGMLTVADCLAASYYECRSSDDEAAPAYVAHWQQELKPRLVKLEQEGLKPCLRPQGPMLPSNPR
ncbi:MAG: hypothetical protein ABWK00_05550, partial [Desulfurococcaceae archaeon]